MDLKNFKVLSKSDYDALSERDQVKYELQLEAYKEQEQTRIATEAAQKAVEAIKLDLQKENKDLLDQLSKDNDVKLKELADKHQLDLEGMTAELKRNKIADIGNRMKGFAEHITEKLSTEEGITMIKEFFSGQKEKFNFELEEEAVKAMGVPVGGVAPQFTAIVGPGHDDIHARSVIPVFPTTSNLIKFIQYVVDPVATGFGMVAVGGQKPDLGWVPTVKEAPVRKIAGILTVPDELLDDVAGFRAWIAYELPKAYLDAEDLQIFKGNGTGENILGLWFQADYQTLPFGGTDGVNSASNTIDKIAAGITEVRTLKRATSAVFVSPIDYMKIFINKGNTQEYTYPVILDQSGNITIGGVPVYWSNVFSSEQGIVGDFARGTAIFQRKAMSIGYFDQNKDNVEKNMVTIRLEGRFALPIFYPESFLRLFPATS